MEAALEYNQRAFDKNYDDCVKDIGFMKFYKDIVTKTMNQISILYLNNELMPANEHFFSENVRRQLQHQIAITKANTTKKRSIGLIYAENEYHDMTTICKPNTKNE